MRKTLLLLSCLFARPGFSQSVKLADLRCVHKINPAGVENTAPVLSWKLVSAGYNVKQAAYQVLVSDDSSALANDKGTIWNSEKVMSDECLRVIYKGASLLPAHTYYWKVKVWDNKKNVSAWSYGKWQMGLLSRADWHGAQWIACEQLADSDRVVLPVDGQRDKKNSNNILPLLRKNIPITRPVKKATAFISGLGQFEMNLNGRKMGDHFLDPGWTKYDKEAQYVMFDLTDDLRSGNNTIGVLLGNGFYYIPPVSGRYRKLKTAFGYPKMICYILIEYKDGSSEKIISDQSWKTAPGPVTFSSIYGGEDYDARLEQPGWDEPSFKADSWKNALMVDGPPQLHAQMQEPLSVFDHFNPRTVIKNANGDWIYDLGQNASGIIKISVKGKRGDTIRIIPGELLKDDGTVNQRPTGSPYYLKYILKGDGTETWQPRFTYYGFRYIQVHGGTPQKEAGPDTRVSILSLQGLHTRNGAARVGTFSSSSELFNKTDALIDWAIKSNLASVMTDCPHREKLGWLEQAHLMFGSVSYNYDIATLCRKTVNDMISSQTPEGLIPEIAPEYVKFEWGGDMFRDSPEWGSSGILVPWYLYRTYGDMQVLEHSYDMMQRYAAYLEKKSDNFILKQGLGDWYDIGPKAPGVSQLTPMGVTGTAIFYYDLTILHKIALLLNKPADAAGYQKLAAQVKDAFNKTFFNRQTRQYATGSQAANAMAVYMGLAEPADREAVIENIIKDIRSRNNSLTAGDIGYRYLLRVLEDAGRSDVIFDMNSRSDVPGYGYQLAKGATALTESWQAYATASNNHFMLGHLMEWFYSGLAGIRQADSSVGYKDIIISPEPVGNVTSAKASYQSPYGEIASAWKKEKGKFQLTITIPANTTAKVYLPAGVHDTITLNGKISRPAGNSYKNSKRMFILGSGNYVFNVQPTRDIR